VNDPYEKLLPYYDAENAGFDDDLHLYLSLRRQGRVLELGCGTGRLALPLAQHGLEVVGVDRSAAMLNRARERAAALGVTGVRWLHADITSLELGESFDMTLLAYNGFLHFLTRAQQRDVLQVMRTHTAPTGLMVIDVSNPLPYLTEQSHGGFVVERSFTDERGYDVIQQTLTTVDRATQHMEVIYVYDYTTEEGSLRRDTIPMQFRLTMAPELELLLESELGLHAEFLGSYEGDPYEEASPRLIALIGGT
jgi:ubiquinone/menaquinone biosynthesis C-methylase UbiE